FTLYILRRKVHHFFTEVMWDIFEDFFFFSSRRRHTRAVSAFLLNRSSDLKDQVYAQNEMLAYQQKESTARVASIMENTNLSKQQQVSEIMRQMLTQAQTAGQYFTNDQIKEMTRKVSAE